MWLPGLFYGGWRAYHQRDPYLGGFVLIAVLFFLTHALILQPSPWRGRYHVVMITIGAPLMLWLFHTEARWRQLMRWVVGVLVVINLGVVLLTNQRKPLIGSDAVQNKDRLDLVADATFHARTFIREFEATVPADALVRLHIDPLPDSDLLPYVVLYPYWGQTLDRTLLPVSGTYTSLAELATAPVRLTFGTSSHLDYPAADYLLIQEGVRATITDFSGFEEVGNTMGYRRGAITLYLYRRVETVVP